ncbi:MAG TPA: transcriptional repressor LexA [Sedimentibacter sp.]|jgi:repressor LexA|nr:transcriptional repressor LexA [Sedimentibacter sp.]NLA13431.1 transcriptional repressor LexA [Tissierellia bacterium]HAS91149.1 repressor LexA [Clostridiales bacterium]HOA18930.1 transcriptional repressor LexA [Sedimentibacter sp.]HOG62666.1 transcriptional repressor LexA [Sedimentibacter sp.]
MSYEGLSDKQVKILQYIKDELTLRGYPPSIREICKAVGLNSTSSVHAHLNTLEEKGYIKKGTNKRRALELIDLDDICCDMPKKEIINLPIIGTVTAGSPILAVENIDDTLPISIDFVGNKESYVLKVKGDSMIEAGILHGDYVIVNSQRNAKNGDIVVALIGDEATVKTFYKEKDHIRLQPQNSSMDPILIKEPYILGVVKAVVRKY